MLLVYVSLFLLKIKANSKDRLLVGGQANGEDLVMVDGFGLDTVAKLTLALKHDSDDCALSSGCHIANSVPLYGQRQPCG